VDIGAFLDGRCGANFNPLNPTYPQVNRDTGLYFAKLTRLIHPGSNTAPFDRGTAMSMKRTYQPSKTRRARRHGFLVRMRTRTGRAVIRNRRSAGRRRLAV
jgi:large subunit ribosomal protein L34